MYIGVYKSRASRFLWAALFPTSNLVKIYAKKNKEKWEKIFNRVQSLLSKNFNQIQCKRFNIPYYTYTIHKFSAVT